MTLSASANATSAANERLEIFIHRLHAEAYDGWDGKETAKRNGDFFMIFSQAINFNEIKKEIKC